MAGQDRYSEWTGSYGRLPRRGVPTPDREMPGDYISPYLRSLMQPAQDPRQQPRTLPPYPTNPTGPVFEQGTPPMMDRFQRGIEDMLAPASTPRQQPRAMPEVANIPDNLIRGNPQPQSSGRTGSMVDRYGDALGNIGRTAGGLYNKFISGITPERYKEPGSSPWARLGDKLKGILPSGGGGYQSTAQSPQFTNGTQRVLQSIGANPKQDFQVSKEDNDSVTLTPAQKNEQNEARLADAREAGIPSVEYGPEIPGGGPIAPPRTQPPRTQASPSYGSPSSGFKNQGPILAPLSPGSNQPTLSSPNMQFANRRVYSPPGLESLTEKGGINAAPGVNDAESLKYDQFLGPQEEAEDQFAIEPTSEALDRYLTHLENMPEQRQPRWWDRIAAGVIGAGEGARSGAGAGFQASQNYLNAPYNQEVARWATKGKGLEEAASLESGSMNNYMKSLKLQSQLGEAESRNEARKLAGLQRDFSNRTGRMNAETRMASLALRRDEFNAEEDTMPDPKTGTVVAINRRTGARRDTGIQSMAYKTYLQRQIMQDRQIQHLGAQERRALAAEAARWSAIEERTREFNIRNPIE